MAVETLRFTGYYVADEIDLKKYYNDNFGKVWKRSWEEPLILDREKAKAYVFAFGCIIFENENNEFKEEVFKEFKKYLIGKSEKVYTESFNLKIFDSTKEIENYLKKTIGRKTFFTTDEEGVILRKAFNQEVSKIIALVVAQAASMEAVEEKTENMLDSINSLLNKFKRTYTFGIKKILEYLLEISKIRTAIISDLMLIEKPEITWEIPMLSEVYYAVRDYFEIKYRVNVVTRKIEYANELAETMSRITYERRAEFLEFMIILLFLIDIILYIFGK